MNEFCRFFVVTRGIEDGAAQKKFTCRNISFLQTAIRAVASDGNGLGSLFASFLQAVRSSGVAQPLQRFNRTLNVGFTVGVRGTAEELIAFLKLEFVALPFVECIPPP